MARYEDEYVHSFKTEGVSGVSAAMRQQGKDLGGLAAAQKRWGDAMAFAGPKVLELGNKLVGFSNENVRMRVEADSTEAKLASLFRVRGFSAADIASIDELATKLRDTGGVARDSTKYAASLLASFGMAPAEMTTMLPLLARQAYLMKVPLDTVALAVGKAFSSGNYAMLRRYGITLDPVQLKQLQMAKAMVESGDAAQGAAGRTMALGIVQKAIGEYTPELTARMGTLEGQQARLESVTKNVRKQMAGGVVDMKAWGDSMLFGMLRPLEEGHEGLLRTAGGAAYLGGYLIKGGGWVANQAREWKQFRAILTMAEASKKTLTAATVADTAAEAKKTAVADAEAAAIGRTGLAAEGAAAKKGLLAQAGAAMTGGLGMKGLLGAEAQTAIGGAGLGASVTSAGLMAGAAAGGWWVGTKIAEAGNIGGARDLRDAKARQRELEATLGGSVGAALTPEMVARYRQAQGIARPTPSGDLRVTIPGDQVLTAQAMQDYRYLR